MPLRSDSATSSSTLTLNEPLRAEIVLLSATPEELSGLSVQLGSAEDFTRYGIDRPFFLQDVEFNIVRRGGSSIVQLRSRSPITEPFLTFLVEATWPSGRLLREYTVLLDPPTYTPPGVQQSPSVQAPVRQAPTDSARIERTPSPTPESRAPDRQPAPQPAQPARTGDPKPLPPTRYDRTPNGDVYVESGMTLWGIATRVRPDSRRLNVNQTMLAIYEANPDAFGGNINSLRSNVTLRIPSADEIFNISRDDAFAEVARQNDAWGYDDGVSIADTTVDTGTGTADDTTDSGAVDEPSVATPADAPAETRPSLVLVPPDEEAGAGTFDDTAAPEEYSREREIEERIAELEAADVPNQQSLIEIRDNELAALRQELADLRGEEYVPEPADDTLADDETGLDDLMTDDSLADDAVDDATADDAAADEPAEQPPADRVVRTADSDDGILDTILGNIWIVIGAVLAVVAGLLFWFMRRGDGGDEFEAERPWETLDGDDDATSFTETMQAPSPEESFVVVEQDTGLHRTVADDTVEASAIDASEDATIEAETPAGEGPSSGQFGSLEDTFSSETAVNLDQTDPLAEADFHMAYGLYDQAADLINGALETDPGDKTLMAKLCEIYFVWGNRDAFVDAATRLQMANGDADGGEWNKIVIMGQQIAPDHDLFAGAEVAASTEAVDLEFDDAGDGGSALDMDFGGDAEGGDSAVVDLGADADQESANDDASSIDFVFGDDDATAETPTIESSAISDNTAEMPTIESPADIDPFDDGTSELPSLDMDLSESKTGDVNETAEINLDDLDLGGLGDDDATELASLDDLDATGRNEALESTDATGKNPEVDPTETGVREALDVDNLDELAGIGDTGTGLHLAADETGASPSLSRADEQEPTDTHIDESLLDATGMTQVLSKEEGVDTGVLDDGDATLLAPGLGDTDTFTAAREEPETLVASLDDDEDDFDFAKTEALPPDAFTGNTSLDDTEETQALGAEDVDLDLDDLTAALQSSEIGDTVEQPRDDATVEQPRPQRPDQTSEIPTMELGPDDLSDDLNEARTMTEVGTKLDLARAYVDMGDPAGARSILQEVLDEGDAGQKQQAQQLLDSLPD